MTGFIGLIRDISEREQVEAALKQSEEKYKAMYKKTPLPYHSLDSDGNILDVNPKWLSTLGYEREEVVGKWIGNFLHPDYIPHLQKKFPEFKKRGHVQTDFKIRHKKGNYIDIKLEGNIGYNPDRSFRQTYCMFEDITEKLNTERKAKLAESALRESEEKFRSVFEYSPLGKSFTSIDGKLIINQAFSDILGYSIDELKSKAWQEITHPDDIPICEEYRQKLLSGDITKAKWEKRFIHKNGDIIWTEINSTLIKDKEQAKYFLTSISNITQRKIAETALWQSRANLNSLINNRNESIWSIDTKYNFVIFNEFFKNAFLADFNIELKKGMNALDILSKELIEIWKPKYDLALSGKSVTFEFSNILQDELHIYEVSLNPIVSDGKIVGVSSITNDISKRKKTEEEQLKTRANLSAIIENTSESIWAIDTSYKILYANAVFISAFQANF